MLSLIQLLEFTCMLVLLFSFHVYGYCNRCLLVCKATCLQDLAKSIVMTYGAEGAEDIAALSRLGAHGWSDGNIHRDLMKLFKKLKAPEPERIRASVFKKDAGE